MAAVAGAGGGAGGGGSGQTARCIVNSRPPTSESRKRNSFIAGLDNSPDSVDSPEFDGTESGQQQEEERRHPIKRACNECRQQKVGVSASNSSIMLFVGAWSISILYDTQGLIERCSFDVMSSKILLPSAQDVADSVCHAKFKRISRELARDLAMQKWKGRSSN